MGHFTIFYRESHQKKLRKRRRKVHGSTLIQSADLLEIEFKVTCDIIESVEFGKIYGFYDVEGEL